jgi:sugar/nucleoside kinase (ribokinase family)
VKTWGLSTRFIARDLLRPTGTVHATLDRQGAAKFTIARGVAWDAIPLPKAPRAEPAPVALVFGTLALRSTFNRETLARLMTKWPRAVRVLDLNLRPPFDAPSAVEFALCHTHLLKLNDTELTRLTGQPTRTLPGARTGDAAARNDAKPLPRLRDGWRARPRAVVGRGVALGTWPSRRRAGHGGRRRRVSRHASGERAGAACAAATGVGPCVPGW